MLPNQSEDYPCLPHALILPHSSILFLRAVNSSTIDQSVAKFDAEAIITKGARATNAPVSGCKYIMTSTTEDFDRAQPILSQMGKNIIHCGKSGSGQITKTCNMLLAISMISVSKTMSLGINPKLLAIILILQRADVGPAILLTQYGILPSNDYKGGFVATLIAKDL
ncbi:11432_t:CDS:2 [Ambispora gerdemannii]|uniref:11432_t:CDS:1 n=1 Tax=Ambispora gerdemannii TaxID=144530 RepID=A0A9N9GBH6_9GLOM|nr:11432_t:CDS:2 [Ambispora gerdemannii]